MSSKSLIYAKIVPRFFASKSFDIQSSKEKIGHQTDGKDLLNSVLYDIMHEA